jgi:hypothetical protein
MQLGNADETEQGNDQESGQLSFPFSVERVTARTESNFSGPNPYSLSPSDDEFLEGGGFFYEKCPEIFLGRSGYGPLRVAWDTNILIGYAEFGELMWADPDFDPPISEPRYREELIALDTLVQIWMWRDIRVRQGCGQSISAVQAGA